MLLRCCGDTMSLPFRPALRPTHPKPFSIVYRQRRYVPRRSMLRHPRCVRAVTHTRAETVMRSARLSPVRDPSARSPLSTEGRYSRSIPSAPPLTRRDCSSSIPSTHPISRGGWLQTRSSDVACLFVAVLREVVVVVGVVDSDNFIGQVLPKPARITIHADTTTADPETSASSRFEQERRRTSRGVSAPHARDLCSRLRRRLARPEHGHGCDLRRNRIDHRIRRTRKQTQWLKKVHDGFSGKN
jgi:hypothetical protein